MFRRILKILLRTILGFIAFVLLYITAAFILYHIPVHSNFTQSKEPEAVEIYIYTNGVHTDLVLPIENNDCNWREQLNPVLTKSKDTLVSYIGFGWGDKGFYLETPTWADLTFSTAFKAMFYLGTSAMHVTFHKELNEGDDCRKIRISRESYRKIIAFVKRNFKLDESRNYILLAGHSYEDNDLFFDATGSYGLFYTCNTWTNQALKSGDLKACLWTPYDKGMFYQYETVK